MIERMINGFEGSEREMVLASLPREVMLSGSENPAEVVWMVEETQSVCINSQTSSQ